MEATLSEEREVDGVIKDALTRESDSRRGWGGGGSTVS